MSKPRVLSTEEYHVGIVCALPHEMAAVMGMLDEDYGRIQRKARTDDNTYAIGRIYEHNVVIACLPIGNTGISPATTVIENMQTTFINLRFCLLVGIGGGIPNHKDDIRLGDVVVSVPEGAYGGVVQHDMGKTHEDGQFEYRGSLDRPPKSLMTALSFLKTKYLLKLNPMKEYLREMNRTYEGFAYPGKEKDILFCSKCENLDSSSSCNICTDGKIPNTRSDSNPLIHFGIIASGNQVIANAKLRDKLSNQFKAKCVEMEAAGIMNNFPCIVIRGICDYADGQTNDEWQNYAAVAAAAFAKWLLTYVTPEQAADEQRIQDLMAIADELKQNRAREEERYTSEKFARCLQAFYEGSYEKSKDLHPDRVSGTCLWVLNHYQYHMWNEDEIDKLLWISADPGCGKSVLAKSLIDNELQSTEKHTVCYFFFKDNKEQNRLAVALRALLHQLFCHQQELILHAYHSWDQKGSQLMEDEHELWRIFLVAARDSNANDVTCVLDALDECEQSDQKLLIEKLAKFHNQTLKNSTRRGRLKFLVTSRPYDEIKSEFRKRICDIPSIQLQGENENNLIREEIDSVIRLQVNELVQDFTIDEGTRDQLESKLLNMEHRTYLWLYLAISDIRETYDAAPRPNEVAVESLPSNVEEAYEKILSRVSAKRRENVRKILLIVAGARRPLTIKEMAIAFGISTKSHVGSLSEAQLDHTRLRNHIREWCGLFIFINHDRIYLIHQTAKEFLIRDSSSCPPNASWRHCLQSEEIEKEMTRICIEYLSLEDIHSVGETLMRVFDGNVSNEQQLEMYNYEQSFLIYVVVYWPEHFRHVEIDLSTRDPNIESIERFYNINFLLQCGWFLIFADLTRTLDYPTTNILCLAVFLNHKNMIKYILQSNNEDYINEADKYGRTALFWAKFRQFGDIELILKQAGGECYVSVPSSGSEFWMSYFGGYNFPFNNSFSIKGKE